jgi:hypothetical protein
MKPSSLIRTLAITGCVFLSFHIKAQEGYKNFEVAVYSRAYETAKMGDTNWMQSVWDEISRQLKVDKIYLETHRDLLVVDEPTLLKAKEFFKSQGIQTAGGITLTEQAKYDASIVAKIKKQLQAGEAISGQNVQIERGRNQPSIEKHVFEMKIKPHSFVVLKLQ